MKRCVYVLGIVLLSVFIPVIHLKAAAPPSPTAPPPEYKAAKDIFDAGILCKKLVKKKHRGGPRMAADIRKACNSADQHTEILGRLLGMRNEEDGDLLYPDETDYLEETEQMALLRTYMRTTGGEYNGDVLEFLAQNWCGFGSPIKPFVDTNDAPAIGGLLGHGADGDEDYDDTTSLAGHALRRRALESFTMLLGQAAGAGQAQRRVALPNGYLEGQPYIVYAAREGLLPFVQVLLCAGAIVDEPHPQTLRTALHESVVAGHVEVVRVLIRDGHAQTSRRDAKNNDARALRIAHQAGNEDLAALFEQ